MWLSGGVGSLSTWTDEGEAAAVDLMVSRGLPFVPLQVANAYVDEAGRQYQDWFWTCPKLQADGRCGIYETRPDLCRDFEPASGPLCVHFGGAEAGDPTLMAE